jgi:hypothetical protein
LPTFGRSDDHDQPVKLSCVTTDVERAYEDFRRQTLWELWSEPSIWEALGDTTNFFPSADRGTRIALAERLLFELWQDGWVRFVRLRARTDKSERGEELDESEVEAVIRSDVWHVLPPTGDALHVVLVPTEKTRSWQQQRLRRLDRADQTR